MASASDPPAHPALQPADRLILPPQHPPVAVETSIGPPHYPAECTHSHAPVQPSLRARTGHANSDSFSAGTRSTPVALPKRGRCRSLCLMAAQVKGLAPKAMPRLGDLGLRFLDG